MAGTRHVRVELLDVICHNTEDAGWVGSHDEFYIAGTVTGGTTSRPVLTQKISIDDGQTRSFGPLTVFEADVPDDLPVRISLAAYDEDSQKEWNRWAEVIDKAQEGLDDHIHQQGAVKDPGSGKEVEYFNLVVDAMQKIGSLDKDDRLGSVFKAVPVASLSDSDYRTWKFSHDDPTGYSSWNYEVHYRVTATGGFRTQWPDRSLLREQSSPYVYVIFGNAKFHVPDPAVLPMYGTWGDVQVVPDGTAEAIPTTPQTSLRLFRESSEPEVYVVWNGQKRHIPNDALLQKYGGWDKVIVLHPGALDDIPTGDVMDFHPRDLYF